LVTDTFSFIDIGFVLIYCIFPLLLYVLMRAVGLRLFVAEVPAFLILAIFAFDYVGILPLYFGWDDYRYAMGVQDRALIWQIYLYTTYSMLSLVAGFAVARHLLGFGSLNDVGTMRRGLVLPEKTVVAALLGICLAVTALYLSKVPSVALFVAVTDGGKAAATARSLMGNDFEGGGAHWYKVFTGDLLSVLAFVLFAEWLLHKGRWTTVLLVVAVIAASFTALMTTAKAPFVWLMVGLVLTYCLVRKAGRLPLRTLINLGAVSFIPLVIFYQLYMGVESIPAAIKSIFSRSFTGQIMPAYLYLEYFPAYHDFLMGASMPNPAGLLPVEHYRLTVEVMNWIKPGLDETGVVGSAPTIFWGELYANFGAVGVAVVPVFVGILVYAMTCSARLIAGSPVRIGFSVWLILHYKGLAVTGVSGFMLDFYLVLILAFVLLINVIGKIRFQRGVSPSLGDR